MCVAATSRLSDVNCRALALAGVSPLPWAVTAAEDYCGRKTAENLPAHVTSVRGLWAVVECPAQGCAHMAAAGAAVPEQVCTGAPSIKEESPFIKVYNEALREVVEDTVGSLMTMGDDRMHPESRAPATSTGSQGPVCGSKQALALGAASPMPATVKRKNEKASPSLETGLKKATSFLTRLFAMVDDPATNACISWSQTKRAGDPEWAFTVWDNCVLERDVIPCFFKHKNFSSFVRQLNQ